MVRSNSKSKVKISKYRSQRFEIKRGSSWNPGKIKYPHSFVIPRLFEEPSFYKLLENRSTCLGVIAFHTDRHSAKCSNIKHDLDSLGTQQRFFVVIRKINILYLITMFKHFKFYVNYSCQLKITSILFVCSTRVSVLE